MNHIKIENMLNQARGVVIGMNALRIILAEIIVDSSVRIMLQHKFVYIMGEIEGREAICTI